MLLDGLKISREKCLLWFGISAFFIDSVMRSSFFHVTGISLPSLLGSINLIAVCLTIILAYYSATYYTTRRSIFLFTVTVLFVSLVFLSDFGAGRNTASGESYWVLFFSLLPGMLINLNRYETINVERLFFRFLRIYNALFLGMFALGFIDFLIGGRINRFIGTYLSPSVWGRLIEEQMSVYGYRLFTFVGSPLMNGFFALVLMVLNRVYAKTYGKAVLNIYVVYGAAMVTIFLTGSRAAFVIGIVFIMVSELLEQMGIWRMCLVIAAFLFLINTPVFQDTIGARLGVAITSASDARYRLVVNFLNHRYGSLRFFSGGGYNYSRFLTGTVMNGSQNFEFPFLMFAFDYGVAATILYYLFFGIYPVFTLISKNRFHMAFGYGMLFLYLQSFNGIAQYYDFNLELGFLMVLLIETAAAGTETSPETLQRRRILLI